MQILLITLAFITGSACLAWVLYQMIQPGQLLEAWQRVLDKVYKKSRLLEMFLGGCYKCFANFIAQVTFCFYLYLQYSVTWLGLWNIAVYLGYTSASIVLAMVLDKFLQTGNHESRLQELENKLEQIYPTLS